MPWEHMQVATRRERRGRKHMTDERSTERMVMLPLTSRTLHAFCLCMCLMNLPICLYDVFLASSVGCPAGRADCMCCV